MGKTVIEELVISLGLDAKELQDSKAIEAINTIRQSVIMLNGDLKETEKLLSSFGKIKVGGGVARTSKPKKASEQDMMGMLGFPRPTAKVPAQQTKPVEVVTKETPASRQERRQRPLRSFRNILDMMPGFASVVYMSKEIFSLAQKIMSMFSESNQAARAMKTTADKSGLNTKTIQTFGLMANKFGGSMEETAKDIEGIITGIPIFGGGQRPKILDVLAVPTHVKGKLRDPEEILKDVIRGVQGRVQGDKVKGARFASDVGMSYSTIMAMSQGEESYKQAMKKYEESGAILGDAIQESAAKIAEKQAETEQKVKNVRAQLSVQNAEIQKAWQDVQVGMWKTLLNMSSSKIDTVSKVISGRKGFESVVSDLVKNIGKEMYSTWKTPEETSMNVKRTDDSTSRNVNAPTSAVINIYGTPTNQSKVEMKLNTKPGPYRENIVRVQ